MTGKIDENGFLFIERVGGIRNQYCPNTDNVRCCGEWCPLFTEYKLNNEDYAVNLQCARSNLIITVIDERLKERNN